MAKKIPLAPKICDWVAKYSIYAVIFLIPIFFLPWTADILDFNKQAVLVLLVFVSFFAFLLKILVTGRFEMKKTSMNIAAGVLFLACLFATIFSAYRYGSFWGSPQQISESLLTVTGLLLFYFLASNVLSKKEIATSAIVLSFSAVISELIGVLQLFGLQTLPFDFAKGTSFNTLGSIGSLGFFVAILFPIATVLLISAKKWWKVLFALEIILSTLILILVNYPIIWWVVIIGSALTLIFGIMKSDLFDGRWMALPMFILAVSLFFVLLNLQVNWLPQKTNEIFISQNSGFSIAMQTLKEKPIFGSGLGTFPYDFSKFKSADFEKSSLWNVVFNKSSSKILTSLATTGALGFLALMAFMVLPIVYAGKFLLGKKNSEVGDTENKNYSILILGLSVALVEQTIAYFLYNSNIVLDFIYVLTIASLIALIFETKKKYVLKSASWMSITATLAFTLVFIFGLGLLILGGQRYAGEVNYYKGLSAYQKNQKADGLKGLETAVSLNSSSDLYFRQLAQAYLLGLQDLLQNTKSAPTDEETKKIQTFLTNSVNAGKIATDINPNDPNNWAVRGYVYQNLFGIFTDAPNLAISSYDSAIKLDPNNPYLYFQEGNVYLVQALGSASLNQNITADQKNQFLIKAQTQLEKAVNLNPVYSDALYYLGLVYDAQGQKDKAIAEFTKVQQLNPTDKTIPQILNNLNAGRPALQSANPPATTPPSGSIKSSTTK
jgi:tetratricopeptide (TPR) repeat protein